ncbi:hypothetical protein MMAD_12590 [Mycolicibacterium madagascariense]|uniref:Uncharacterized protein n=1 Tax=Mycolicibacterium madagascariense TaxID=212765 RepID=A0A7I7XBJ4_9MYCO|nr:tetratricopeptide repeat protein [Mycolicibacterium madagascariense]MCV7013518.1 tetratricopeptide repeat protein [Mycolicibacterium madagascariense]BBZ26964.1 hypothetical protein MMAD_12590 [Mycolicibacterium madagascariense]
MDALVEVAFGPDPGRWPLPAATTADELWLRAVAAGGQGRYASALSDLDRLARARPEPVLASHAFGTRASFERQLGRHEVARSWDGRAVAAAGQDVEAAADALIGLAADALGRGRFALSRQLLERAADLLGNASGRVAIRLSWVSAELAMCTGRGSQAVGYAEAAVRAAEGWPSARHAAKSQVVLAAALCGAGDLDAARRVAQQAWETTERLGLVPLSWALTCLLHDVGGSSLAAAQIAAARDAYAATVAHRGGDWSAR